MKVKLGKIDLEYFFSENENENTVIFVHGLGANLSQFENQHDFFQDKYNVLSINLRGHGNTTASQELTELDFTVSELSNDIIMLFDILGIKKAHYIGNSMGGNVGYELLKNNSNRLLSFTTFGTTAKLNKLKITVDFMKIIYKLLNIKTIAKLSSFTGRNKDSKNKIKKMMGCARKETILKIIPNLVRFDYLNVIKSANIPSMIIQGDMDRDINKVIESTIDAWKEKDNFRLIKMKNAGHFANLDNPEEFNKIIESFLEYV
ncbi:MAG: alpha/beta hydrolase [Methanosarcinaceae archaeon]|nr:alpha/beta hydrolase [Methanosarcinaceae archaeon]